MASGGRRRLDGARCYPREVTGEANQAAAGSDAAGTASAEPAGHDQATNGTTPTSDVSSGELEGVTPEPPWLRILFVHIPKTAGRSLYSALEAWATPARSIRFARGGVDDHAALLALTDDEIARLRLVSGHQSLPDFRKRLGSDWTAITVLRDPVERALSLVSFVFGEPEHPWHERAIRMGIGDFLAWYRDEPFSVNQMCQFISNTQDPTRAYRILKQDVGLSCTVEHLPALVQRLGEMVGHEIVLPHKNASQDRLDRSEVDEGIVAAIEVADRADQALYERVRRSGLVGTLADSRWSSGRRRLAAWLARTAR
jgi:hypothetical protein